MNEVKHTPGAMVPDFFPVAGKKLEKLLADGWSINGYAIINGERRGFIDFGGFVGWWLPEYYAGHTSDDTDLLAALKLLCDHEASYHSNEIRIACSDHGDAIRRMRIARAAIAKAEGRSP